MKWTMIALTFAGALAYMLIFVAQHGDEGPQTATAAAGAGDPELEHALSSEPVVETAVATLDPPASVPEPEVGPPTPRWTGNPWTAGVKAFERRDWELAREALQAAVDEKESSAYRHYLLGLCYLRLDDAESAVSELSRSAELGTSVRTYVNLGRAQLALEDTLAAREAVDAALDITLDDADAWNVLGRVELSEGHLEEAAAAFGKAIDRDADHAWALNNLGYVRILQERFDEAVAPLRQAARSGVDAACFYNNLGVALERSGELGLAVLAYAQAADRGHGPAEASLERTEGVLLARGESVPEEEQLWIEPEVVVAAEVAEEEQP